MNTVRATCPECGDIKLTSKDVNVVVFNSNNEGAYRFTCPETSHVLGSIILKKVGPGIMDALVSAGCELEVIKDRHLPEEIRHQQEVFAALGPITSDEQIDLHLQLEDDDLTAEAYDILSIPTSDT